MMFQCSRCAHQDEVEGDPKDQILRCSECGTFFAFGVELPRVTNQPHAEDRRFVTMRVEHAGAGCDAAFTFEREYARGIALDILSIADPVVFQAFQTIAAAMLGLPRTDAVAELDAPMDNP